MKQCPRCSAEHTKPGTFCSRKCANSRVFSEESKLKKSIAIKKHIAANGYYDNAKNLVDYTGKKLPEDIIAKRSVSRKANTMDRFESGKVKDNATLKRILAELLGYKCAVCGIHEWHGQLLSLQLDHIDGDASNTLPNNVRLICPNCHTLTPTWGAKNKGRGRKARGLNLW